jgi:fucose permease
MITTVILILIYFAFISLGLPDSLLGVSWPAMQTEWGLPLDAAGLVAFILTVNTIASSLLSSRIIKRLGTGKVTFLSCLMTGAALLGISFSPSYLWLLFLAVPLGFGAGSVDVALNNYVALHFKAFHMNWLHSFWGLGATIGPLIMARSLSHTSSWRPGYRIIAVIQLGLAVLLFVSLPIWIKHGRLMQKKNAHEPETADKNAEKHVLKIKGVPYALATFLLYCGAELSVGLWGSSYLVHVRNIPVETAALWIAMYYGGITAGRFLSGFISLKLTNTQMIRGGIIVACAGIALLFWNLPDIVLIAAFILIGIGFSPIFPAMIHETPRRFGKKKSQEVIGYQMGFAYIGSALIPPLFGMAAESTTMGIFPFFLAGSMILIYFVTQKLVPLSKW